MPVPWTTAVANGPAVRIGYETDPCTKARRATLERRDNRVVVTLYDTERDPKQACIQILERGCVSFRMAQGLGGQKLVDGAPRARERSRGIPIERFGACRPVPLEEKD